MFQIRDITGLLSCRKLSVFVAEKPIKFNGHSGSTLECLIIVYTRNIFFGKFSLLHAVIKHLHDFRRRASRGENYFSPSEIQKIWENNFEFHQHFVNYAHFSCKYIVTCQIFSLLILTLIFDFLAKIGNSLIHDY